MGVDWWAMGILMYEMLVGTPPFYGTLMETYQGIVKYKPPTKGLFDPVPGEDPAESELRVLAKDLILKLLQKNRTMRLGCLFGGTQDVKDHPFFAGIDWDAMSDGTIDIDIDNTPLQPEDLPAVEQEEMEEVEPPTELVPETDPENFKDF